ncbi:hypothetical protein GIB67_007552 [Kingdonia uniflora]|uniref:QLQ domain-containing protein n=1 Tax=Kingdonia uniflora TaxID=39325 RepID=A0A7J7LN43_9MAGN|nr:hypothetical protein GIB67_007552 [Kingdonia uniflora]
MRLRLQGSQLQTTNLGLEDGLFLAPARDKTISTSPRSQSPANVRSSNENTQIYDNCIRAKQLPLKPQAPTNANKPNGFSKNKAQRGPDERTSEVAELVKGNGSNKPKYALEELKEAKGLLQKSIDIGVETVKPQTITRSRSSRMSRDLDTNNVFNPDNLLNPPPTSYTSLLLEDIQNFLQQNTTTFTLPRCVTKACSILDTVADLNSYNGSNLSQFSSERGIPKHTVLTRMFLPSLQNLRSVNEEEMEQQESSGGNSAELGKWKLKSSATRLHNQQRAGIGRGKVGVRGHTAPAVAAAASIQFNLLRKACMAIDKPFSSSSLFMFYCCYIFRCGFSILLKKECNTYFITAASVVATAQQKSALGIHPQEKQGKMAMVGAPSAMSNLKMQELMSLQAKMAAMQKAYETQPSRQLAPKQQYISSPATGSENSAHVNSSSDMSMSSLSIMAKAKQVIPSVSFASTPTSTMVNANNIKMQQLSRQTLNRTTPHSAVSFNDGGSSSHLPSQVGPKAPASQQLHGLTKQQLYVLKANIMAFRRLKRGEGNLPPEVLQAIAPPSLVSQLQ